MAEPVEVAPPTLPPGERGRAIERSGGKPCACRGDDLKSNWACMVMTTLAWNLQAWFALLGPDRACGIERLKMGFRTFLQANMPLPAQIVLDGATADLPGVGLQLVVEGFSGHLSNAFERGRPAVGDRAPKQTPQKVGSGIVEKPAWSRHAQEESSGEGGQSETPGVQAAAGENAPDKFVKIPALPNQRWACACFRASAQLWLRRVAPVRAAKSQAVEGIRPPLASP